MPQLTFTGLPIASFTTFSGILQNLLLLVLIYFSVVAFLARRRAVLMALEIKKSDERWSGDDRFKIPWIAPVDPAIRLLWGKLDDLPEQLRDAILSWRSLTNRAFAAGLMLAAVMIWRN